MTQNNDSKLGLLKCDLKPAIIEKRELVRCRLSTFWLDLRNKIITFLFYLPVIKTFDEIYLVLFHFPGSQLVYAS